MKTKRKITSNATLKILPALMVAITAALVTQPVRATASNLVITENSSTSLTATLDNNPLEVDPFGADGWFIVLSGVSTPTGLSGTQSWEEPENTGGNMVEFNELIPGQLFVQSDSELPGPLPLLDGTPDTQTFTLNGGALSVTFFDKGDVAAAPDTGTTASLLGVSLMGLGFLRRKLC